LYKDHVASQNNNQIFNKERTLGGQLLSVTDKTKTERVVTTMGSENKGKSKSKNRESENSIESSKMIYTYSDDDTVEVLETEVETKYQLPKLAKNLVNNKKKINY
jgi:hypothetical protein